MRKAGFFGAALFAASLGGLALTTSGPTSAMPGWSHPGDSSVSIQPEQREQINALHSAYRAALAKLDWSIVENGGENGHAPETMQQARELRMALRAEIFDVLHRDGQVADSAPEGACPYSGQPKPVRLEGSTRTLYL